MSCSTGASSGSSITTLVATGAADKYLTYQPTITLWRFAYNHYTNFSYEMIEQNFQSQPAFGTDVQVILNRTGDLIYFQYVVYDLPGITCCTPTTSVCGIGGNQFPCCDPCDPCGDGPAPQCVCPGAVVSSVVPDDELVIDGIDTCTGLERPWAHYTNAIGQYLTKKASFVAGGNIIDTLYNDFLFMWEELTGRPGARLLEMIGKRFTRAQLVADSSHDRRLYVPLPWWFTMISGQAFPLISCQFHGIQINVCFAELRNCVQVSDCDSLVVKCRDCQPLVAGDLLARLDTMYIFLDKEERDRFATGSFDQLIVQHQQFSTCTQNCQVRVQLNFNHPVQELIYMVRRKCQEQCNNWFNYSGKWGFDPVKAAQIRLNNLCWNAREGRYFRLVMPYQFHTNIPDSFTYCMVWAMHPEEAQPSGTVNFSRIDNVEVILDIQDALADDPITVTIFGINRNVLRFRDGLVGLAFSN